MGRLARTIMGGWLAAALAIGLPSAAATAQDAPVPRVYPPTGFERASTYPDPERLARDTAAADAAEAACDAGDLAGCTRYGAAFETGAGRAQNRPVAELLYRQACNGAEAEGCYRLAELLRFADDRAAWRVSADLYVRACQLGWAAGCDEQANDIEGGVFGVSDPEGAAAMRRANCARGNTRSCQILGERLTAPFASPAEKAEGRALFDRECRAGAVEACSSAAGFAQDDEGGPGPRTRTYQGLGCGAGNAWACDALGKAVMRGEWDGGAAQAGVDPRLVAIRLFNRACAIDSWRCDTARAVSDEDALNADCLQGAVVACLLLARVYEQEGGPLEDLPRGAWLRGMACEVGDPAADSGETCARAGERALRHIEAGAIAFDPRRVESWLVSGCDAGSREACLTLGDGLAQGTILAADVPRALTLFGTLCEQGYRDGCDRLRGASRLTPDAPLLVAADDSPPPEYSDEEMASMAAAHMEDQRRREEEQNARACTTTDVEFRGTRYIDVICVQVTAVINGFVARVGSAPWQALLWRPEKMGQRTLTRDQRVLCGGAVIRPGWILTAAHCLTDTVDGVRYPVRTSGHRIRLGVFNPIADEGFSYPILNVIQHPDYKRDKFVFDIALVQYDPARGQKLGVVRPVAQIRLDRKAAEARPIPARMAVYTFGWGRTALEGGAPPDRLRGARLELLDNQACGNLTGFSADRRDIVLCGAGPRGQQACYGDSGGPLITYGEADKVPTVIGVVSAGIKCGTTGVASRFTRIGHKRVQAWLRSILPDLMRP